MLGKGEKMKKISLWGAQSLKKMLNIVLSVEANTESSVMLYQVKKPHELQKYKKIFKWFLIN